MTPADIIAAARVRIVNRSPYVSAVLLSLRPHPMPGLGTVAVTAGWQLLYDPDTLQEWGVGNRDHDGTSAALAHEVWHCLKDHFDRQNSRDAQKWNFAGDREINDDLIACGWRFPIQPLMPADIKCKNGELAEHYYEMDKQPPQQPKTGKFQAMPGCGGKCGGCAGNPHDGEPKDGKPSAGGTEKKADAAAGEMPPDISAADQAVLRRQVAQDIDATIRNPKTRGTVPAGLKAWAEVELGPPKVDWRKQLAAMVRGAIADKAGAMDYTYRRSSRRQWGMRAVLGGRAPILPALRSPVPVVKGILDVSGSMSGAPALAARAEIVGICRALGSPVEFVSCDTRIAARVKVGSRRDIVKLGDTGGGTDMRVAIRDLDKDRSVNILITITDGETPWPARGETRAKIIAAITPGGTKAPDWIPSVIIGD